MRLRHLRGEVEGKKLTMEVNMQKKTLTLIIDGEEPVETGILPFPVRANALPPHPHPPRPTRV